MKKNMIFVFLLSLVLVCMAGCGQKETTEASEAVVEETEVQAEAPAELTDKAPVKEVNVKDIYQEILDHYYWFIVKAPENYTPADGEMGVMEMLWIGNTETERLETCGYVIEDVNGDGMDELIIGDCMNKEYPTNILAMYTVADGKAVLILEGISRNTYNLQEDGEIFNFGSNGAWSSIYATYKLGKDGVTLECTDYYFSDFVDIDSDEIGYYHNQTGEYDKAVSEKLDYSDEKFWGLYDEYQAKGKVLDLIPFADHFPMAEEEDFGEGTMSNPNDMTEVLFENWTEDTLFAVLSDPLTDLYTAYYTEEPMEDFVVVVAMQDDLDLYLEDVTLNDAGELEATGTRESLEGLSKNTAYYLYVPLAEGIPELQFRGVCGEKTATWIAQYDGMEGNGTFYVKAD